MANRVSSIEEGLEKIRADLETHQDAKADKDCINAFKLDTNYVFQKDRNSRCAPDTGQWFFHHPDFQAFQDGKGRQLLFVTAEAGGGKSTIMRTFVDRLQGTHDQALVAYYFFKDDDDQLRSYEDALSSIIYQLFVTDPCLVKCARGLYKRYGHGVRYQTKQMWSLLMMIASESQKDVTCVLDAVDECAPAGRRQLVYDLGAVFQSTSPSLQARLKFVVTSRPYQDANHPYADLVTSDTIRHLAGENAKVQSDIQAVITFKAEQLAQKRRLSQQTLDYLVESISNQNLQTRSFLAVQIAFELLDSHSMMHEGAEEHTIQKILAEIPNSLADQFDAMLNRSLDKEHARRLFCVILAARKTLKIPELKVLYALTQPTTGDVEPPRSYDELKLNTDDEAFKQLIRARCGLFITFVRSSVHLFHQTAREHLMADISGARQSVLYAASAPRTSVPHELNHMLQQHSWKGCISDSDANLVWLHACLDLFNFEIPKSWVLGMFDDLNAGNEYYDSMQRFLENRPVFQYAAFNWYEHAILGSDKAQASLCSARYAVVLDVSKPSFWVWFLVLADYVGSSRGKPESLISTVWEEGYRKHRLGHEYGLALREMCLTKLYDLDTKMRDLLNDTSIPLHDDTSKPDKPVWTATEGYELIDKYHLACGEYEYTSFNRAVQCIESGQLERSERLSAAVPKPVMIWTCISEGATAALKKALANINDIDWLHEVPEHLMCRRNTWKGSSSRTGKDLREEREHGWKKPCPPTFIAAARAMTLTTSRELFYILADWIDASGHAKEYAQQLWEVGGFMEPSFCRRLLNTGIPIDFELWNDRRTALQIAAALWEHDSVKTLLELGASPSKLKSNGRSALHWFLSGPETLIEDSRSPFSFYGGKKAFLKLSEREKQRIQKSRISDTLTLLSRSHSAQTSPLEEPDENGKTPLRIALQGSRTATKSLLDAGADVERKDRWGRTPLMHFFNGGFNGRPLAILKHLMNAGADSLAIDMAGHSVLQYWERQVVAMDLGSLYAGYTSFNKGFDILTSTGALSDNDVLIRELTARNVPLAAAVQMCNAKLCWALLRAGANPNEHGLFLQSRLIEQNGTEADDLADVSWKPLMIALQSRAYTTAAILLAHGADVAYQTPTRKRTKYNRYRRWGLTPLHLAAGDSVRHSPYNVGLNTGGWTGGCSFKVVGNPERTVKKKSGLYELGRIQMEAYKNSLSYQEQYKDLSSDSEYEIPHHRFHNDSIGKKLLPYDKVSKEIMSQMRFDDPLFDILTDCEQTEDARQLSMVELLLKKGAPVNAKTSAGATTLLCMNPSLPLANMLLGHGADPNIATTNGTTPLMLFAAANELAIVKSLLNAGANPNAQLVVPSLKKRDCAAFMETYKFHLRKCHAPLSALALAAERGHYAIVETLLKHGADPNLPIEHHAHGRLPTKQETRRAARRWEEPDSSESETEEEKFKGYVSVATALTWARDEVRELLLQHGADPRREQAIRECDCKFIERRKDTGLKGSDDDYPTNSESDGSDAKLRKRPQERWEMPKWDGDSDSD